MLCTENDKVIDVENPVFGDTNLFAGSSVTLLSQNIHFVANAIRVRLLCILNALMGFLEYITSSEVVMEAV